MKHFIFNSNKICENPNYHYLIYHTDLLLIKDLPIEATPFLKIFSKPNTDSKNADSYQILIETLNYYSSLDEKDRIFFAVYTALNPISNRWQFGFYYNPFYDIQQDFNVLKGDFLDENTAKVAGWNYFLTLYDKQQFCDNALPFVDFIKERFLGKQLIINF